MRKTICLLLLVLPFAAHAVDYRITWTPVEDDRLTGYEVFVSPESEEYPATPTWSGADEQTSQLSVASGTPMKAMVRAVGEQAGEVIHSGFSDELRYTLRERQVIYQLSPPLILRIEGI